MTVSRASGSRASTAACALLTALPILGGVVLAGCAAPTVNDDSLGLPERTAPEGSTGNTASTPVEQPAPRAKKQGVVFVHGTSDHGDVSSLTCSGMGEEWHCVSKTAVAEYWAQETIDSERKRTNGALRPYVVVGCPLAAQTPWPNPTPVKPKNGPAEPGSAACVAAEAVRFLNGPDGDAGTDDDIDDVVLVTHSGGSNVVRYILQQHTAQPAFERVHTAARGFIGIAAPSRGTYLADRVFRFTLIAAGNKLFGAGYDDDGVDFIQTTKMALFNGDPAKLVDVAKDVAGVPSFMASGAFTDKEGDEAKSACGGESETKGLNLLHELYFDATDPETFRDGCSDGFISCQSAMALANGDPSRVIFGQLAGGQTIGKTHFRAHNQSRRVCDDLDVDVRSAVNRILDGQGLALRQAPSTGPLAARERFTPFARSVATHFRGVALEAAAYARAGDLARVHVKLTREASSDGAALRGFLQDPSGEVHVPASFERDEAGHLVALARIPNGGRAGAWTMHIGERASDIDEHLEATLPLWVAGARGEILATRVERDDGGLLLHVTLRADAGARVGIHATLVSELDGDTRAVSTAQASADANGSATTEITVHLPLGRHEEEGALSIRDVALVSHDEASTLDVRSRVELSP